jgi:hypothetical protein
LQTALQNLVYVDFFLDLVVGRISGNLVIGNDRVLVQGRKVALEANIGDSCSRRTVVGGEKERNTADIAKFGYTSVVFRKPAVGMLDHLPFLDMVGRVKVNISVNENLKVRGCMSIRGAKNSNGSEFDRASKRNKYNELLISIGFDIFWVKSQIPRLQDSTSRSQIETSNPSSINVRVKGVPLVMVVVYIAIVVARHEFHDLSDQLH